MPNGTSAPGKVLPPPLVQVRVSTSCAGLVVADLTVDLSVLAAGAFTASGFFAQFDVPPIVVVHVAIRSPGPAFAPGLPAAACAGPVVSTLPTSALPATNANIRARRAG